MQKRTIYSLLLTSFILVFAFSTAFAQEVTFESKSVLRCQSGVMNITVNNPDPISALEIVFDVSSLSGGADFTSFTVNWDPAFLAPVLPTRDIQYDGNLVRMYAWENTTGDCLGSGPTVVAQISFVTNEVCDGEVEIVGSQWVCPPPSTVVVETWFADCVTAALIPVLVNPGTVTIENAPPSIDAIAGATIHWGDTYTHTATATDNDLLAVPGNCETLTFSKVSGPSALYVSANGDISWVTTGDDVCEHTVQVAVTDECLVADTTDFVICVQNTKPEIYCVDDIFMGWGDVATGTLTGYDPDGGPGSLMYFEVSFDGPGDLVVHSDGTFEWATEFMPEYTGTFNACVGVKDAADVCDPCSPENADTCCFQITVVPFLITIEKVHKVIQGRDTTVSITMLDDEYENHEIGGFDFLIQYDPTALLVNSVVPGNFIDSCGWEYFTYRYGPNGNCGPNACPSGILRITAIAETNNGDNHPDCFTNETPAANELAKIHFFVTNDRTFECQYVPIRFIWYDCGDNALSSVTGDTLFISRDVFDYSWNAGYADWINIANYNDPLGYPTLFGAQDVDCFLENRDKVPFRLVDFRNGGIDIACADSIDARGDVNLNEVPYEVADAVLFSNYFVYGLSVFHINADGQIAATDVNADGLTLSVADLVYLIRVVVGDALPYPKTVVPVNAGYVHTNSGMLTVTDNVDMGAAYVVVEGNVEPRLEAANMEMKYQYDGMNTRILVFSLNSNSFTGNVLNVRGNIVSVEMATAAGDPVVAKAIPTDFALHQNYPNPFNPTTTLSFALPYATDYNLTIYNVNGQEVASFTGSADAGTVSVEWNAVNLASGIYLYKLTADGKSIGTKKMVLLK